MHPEVVLVLSSFKDPMKCNRPYFSENHKKNKNVKVSYKNGLKVSIEMQKVRNAWEALLVSSNLGLWDSSVKPYLRFVFFVDC